MQPSYTRNGIPASPFVIAKADFLQLLPVYQRMVLALQQTEKILILDYPQSSTALSACVPSTEPVTLSEGYRNGGQQAAGDHQSESARLPADVRPIFPSGNGVSTSSRESDCGECVAIVGCSLGTRSRAAGETAPLGSYKITHTGRQQQTWITC